MMSRLKAFAVVSCLVLAFGAFLPTARADQYDEKTELTFNQPFEIPGAILPAGTYWFVLLDSPSNRDVVRIYSQDWSELCATEITAPAIRQQTPGQTEVRFAERPHNRPQALVQIYYPGLEIGHEFIYLRREEKELARDAKLDIITRPMNHTYAPASAGE
jgi:hypothetical protein